MADRILKANIFRFVSVRPPQAPKPETLPARFARYLGQDPPPFQAEIAKLEGAEDARNRAAAVAREYLAADDYIAHPQHRQESFKVLQQLEDALEIVDVGTTNIQEIANELEDCLKQPLSEYVKSEEFTQIEEKLWDGYYANILAPRERPEDREPLVLGIRLIHLLRALVAYEPKKKLPTPVETYLAATPVVPKNLFPTPKKVSDENLAGQQTDHENNSDQGIQEQQALEELRRLSDAIADVKEASRKHRAELIEQQAQEASEEGDQLRLPPPRRESLWQRLVRRSGISSRLPEPQLERPFASRTQIRSPWQLGGSGAKHLCPSTRDVLDEYNISLENRTVPEIVEALQEEMRGNSPVLSAALGRPQVRRLGNVYVDTTAPASSTARAFSLVAPNQPLAPPRRLRRLGRIRSIGTGDLMVVEQTLLRYERGEIAHIENILMSEFKKRKHRRLRRTEELFIQETERSEESERDLQSTERFELQRESQKTIESDTSFQAGITVTAGFGPVETTAYADFATQQSRSESNRTASSYARDITERSVSRIIERVREERTRKTLEEFEEINIHGFDNKDGEGHISGIYRWVDKIYRAQVVNYGHRMMLELIIPEPAAFYIHAETNKSVEGTELSPPSDPVVVQPSGTGYAVVPLKSHRMLSAWNYELPVSMYNVQDVTPPPAEELMIATSINQQPTEGVEEDSDGYIISGPSHTISNKELKVPDGYQAKEAWVQGGWTGWQGQLMKIMVGYAAVYNPDTIFSLNGEMDIVPIAIFSHLINTFAVNVEVRCERLPIKFETWQLETFNNIMTAYEQKRADYEEQLAAAEIQQGIEISGRNPIRNREIEREELKKSCITVISGGYYGGFNAMSDNVPPYGYPEFDIGEAHSEGRDIQFLEQAFEWDQMTYLFYPYFWGRKANWLAIHQLEDTDPLFTKFLQAGAARVQIPVRPAYNDAVRHYLSTSPPEIWNGGQAPVIDDPLYVSIADDLREQTGGRMDGTPVGPCWEVKVPTSLVILDDDANLPDWSDSIPDCDYSL